MRFFIYPLFRLFFLGVFVGLIFVPASAQKKPNLLSVEDKFSEDAILSSEMSSTEVHKIYSGTFEGAQYRYYLSDGSGVFQGFKDGNINDPMEFLNHWSVACEKDSITDRRHCYLNKGDLFISVFRNGRVEVSVGNYHFPRSSTAIRLDSKRAVYASPAGLSGQAARRFIAEARKAKTITTRYERLIEGTQESSIDAFGFSQAMDYLEWAVRRIK